MRAKIPPLTLGLTLALIGCRALRFGEGTPKTQEVLRLSPTNCRADVPIPEGFALRAERSFHVERPLLAHLVYETRRMDTATIVRFYLKEMPVAHWQRIIQVEAAGRTVLAFRRGSEVCLIHIEQPAGLLPRTRLTIEIVGTQQQRER